MWPFKRKPIPQPGETWYFKTRANGPWPSLDRSHTVTIIDVREGWVRYDYGVALFRDERTKLHLFLMSFEFQQKPRDDVGWIPIAEEPAPDLDPPVLVTDGAYVAEVWRRGDAYVMTTCGCLFEDVTHWMHVPAAPKLEETP